MLLVFLLKERRGFWQLELVIVILNPKEVSDSPIKTCRQRPTALSTASALHLPTSTASPAVRLLTLGPPARSTRPSPHRCPGRPRPWPTRWRPPPAETCRTSRRPEHARSDPQLRFRGPGRSRGENGLRRPVKGEGKGVGAVPDLNLEDHGFHQQKNKNKIKTGLKSACTSVIRAFTHLTKTKSRSSVSRRRPRTRRSLIQVSICPCSFSTRMLSIFNFFPFARFTCDTSEGETT